MDDEFLLGGILNRTMNNTVAFHNFQAKVNRSHDLTFFSKHILDDLIREFEPTANYTKRLRIALEQLKDNPKEAGSLYSALKTWYDLVKDVNDEQVPPMSKIMIVAKSDQSAFWMTFWRVVCNPGYKHMDAILKKIITMVVSKLQVDLPQYQKAAEANMINSDTPHKTKAYAWARMLGFELKTHPL
jgi:hypothetical protein